MSAQSSSQSAELGLQPQDKPSQNAGRGPGSGIGGTTGVADSKGSVAGTTVSGVAGMPQGESTLDRPGAGDTILKPSQGSNKRGDESGGLLNKLNPLKKD